MTISTRRLTADSLMTSGSGCGWVGISLWLGIRRDNSAHREVTAGTVAMIKVQKSLARIIGDKDAQMRAHHSQLLSQSCYPSWYIFFNWQCGMNNRVGEAYIIVHLRELCLWMDGKREGGGMPDRNKWLWITSAGIVTGDVYFYDVNVAVWLCCLAVISWGRKYWTSPHSIFYYRLKWLIFKG